MSEATEYAWAAGFIDGEGCFSDNGLFQAKLSVTQVDPEALFRLQCLMGGRVRGPYSPPSHKGKPYYVYNLGVHGLRAAIVQLWPYLCGPKKKQYAKFGKPLT